MHQDGRKATTTEDNSIASTQTYMPRYAHEAEKLLLLGATREELRKFFGVHEVFLDIWADTHADFAEALVTKPTSLSVGCNDYGLIKWLYDYRRGALNV
jgi:hypothetical protein